MEIEVKCKCSPVKFSTKCGYPQSRHKHAACAHENHVYVYAGKDGNISLKDFWKFNTGCLKWEKVCYRGDMPQHLEGHTLVSYKKLLLLFGGEFGDALTESSLWIINPDLGYIRQSNLDPGSNRPCVRRDHSAVVYNGSMYIYGGYVDVRGTSSELWQYKVDDEEWELLLPRKNDTPGGRYGHTTVVYNKHMWLYGGHTDLVPKQDLWTYSFNSNRWEKIKFKYGPPQLTGHTAVVVGSQMILYGGECNREPVNQMWSFSFKSERWSQITSKDHIPCPRTFHCAVAISPSSSESALKESSMPNLQKKMKELHLERPRSSPAERPRSSPSERSKFSINAVESDIEKRFENCVSNEVIDRVNAEKCLNQQINRPHILQLFSVNSDESLKDFPSSAENTEDKSPLVPNQTDYNYNAVNMLNRNVVNNGIDNPGISKSTEELIQENRLSALKDIEGYNGQVESPSQPNFYRSASQTADVDKRKHLYRQNTDSGISTVPTNQDSLLYEDSFSHMCAKRCRLDSDLVLEDLEFLDCFPHKLEVPYPKSNCSNFKSYVSSESIEMDSDGLETIELGDFGPRVRSKSLCQVLGHNPVTLSRNCIQYNKSQEKVYLNVSVTDSQGSINQSVCGKKDMTHRGNQYKKVKCLKEMDENSRKQGEVTKVDMETSFQCVPTVPQQNRVNEKYNSRYTKHKKPVPSDHPYLLIIGGKDKQVASFTVKPLPLWKVEFVSSI